MKKLKQIAHAIALFLAATSFWLPFCVYAMTNDRFLSVLALVVSIVVMLLSCRIYKN